MSRAAMSRGGRPSELRSNEAAGGGTPVVFLHGFLGDGVMWSPVLDALRPLGLGADRLVLATLPGHGPGAWTPPGDFDAVVDALSDELRAKRPDSASPFVLAGYSMGARLALATALRHPTRVASAVLVGVDPGLEDPAARAARCAWDDAQAAQVTALGLPAFVTAWEALPQLATHAALSESARMAQRAMREGHTEQGIAWAMRALGLGRMPSQWAALARAPLPLRIVTGARDEKFTALGAKIARTAPRALHRVAPGVGHNVALEAPEVVAEEIAAAVREADESRGSARTKGAQRS